LGVWSAGCASGEEPYTVALIWRFALAARFDTISLAVVATDADETVLARARNALYPPGCLAEFPQAWADAAFVREGRSLRLRPEYRAGVTFLGHDLKSEAPDGPFDLILCRNLAFTYFDAAGQRDALARLAGRLVPRGALVIGRRESLPPDRGQLEPWIAELGIFRRAGALAP
jgi:chemotaxis protein methyltransferase CheR